MWFLPLRRNPVQLDGTVTSIYVSVLPASDPAGRRPRTLPSLLCLFSLRRFFNFINSFSSTPSSKRSVLPSLFCFLFCKQRSASLICCFLCFPSPFSLHCSFYPSTMDAAALWCNICPKQPRFSDVSHLLTHVSSKAHLSHYFKLQVRSHQEPQAGDLLDEYDRWYKANNLAKLLSDRMASKEARKNKAQGKAAGVQGTTSTKKSAAPKAPSSTASSQQPGPLPDFLDPRLSQPYFGVNHAAENTEHSFPVSYNLPNGHSTPNHQVQLWQTRPAQPAASPTRPASRQWKTEHDSDSENEAGSLLHSTPKWSGRVNATIGALPRSLCSGVSSDPFVEDDQSWGYADDNEDDKEKVDEMTRLKGVLWPGMDIFDSATEQMRRKRNQKKDGSILKMMEKASEDIEPTELVFSPTGILRKQRVISGNIEDSSPLKGETPIPKRRAVRPKRGPLSQSDPNTVSRRSHERKKAKKKAGQDQSHSLEGLSRQALPLLESPGVNRSFGYYNGYYPSLGDDDSEFRLSLGESDAKPRGGFTVFNDEQRQSKSGLKDQSRSTNLASGSSAGSHSFYHRHEPLAFGSMPSSTTTRGYTPNLSSMAPRYATGKENIEPILNCQGRIDPHMGWRTSWAKHQYGDEAYPPHYFFGDGHHVEFGPFGGNDLSGYSCNPLAISRLPVHQGQVYVANNSPGCSTPKVKRAPSSDATISDTEQDDGRLYLDGSSD